jgi:hypothetical protein
VGGGGVCRQFLRRGAALRPGGGRTVVRQVLGQRSGHVCHRRSLGGGSATGAGRAARVSRGSRKLGGRRTASLARPACRNPAAGRYGGLLGHEHGSLVRSGTATSYGPGDTHPQRLPAGQKRPVEARRHVRAGPGHRLAPPLGHFAPRDWGHQACGSRGRIAAHLLRHSQQPESGHPPADRQPAGRPASQRSVRDRYCGYPQIASPGGRAASASGPAGASPTSRYSLASCEVLGNRGQG